MISAKILIVAMVMSAIIIAVMADISNKPPPIYFDNCGRASTHNWNRACEFDNDLNPLGRCRPAGYGQVNDNQSKALYKCWNLDELFVVDTEGYPGKFDR